MCLDYGLVSLHIDSDGIELRSYLAAPADVASSRGLVLCHGFPQAPREAASAGLRYAELADRIADQVGMTVLTFNFRGTGQSEGDFSLDGWWTDLQSAVRHLRDEVGVPDVWLAGFGAGGSMVLQAGAMDASIKGVASFSARAHFDDWAKHWEHLLDHARNFGMVRSENFPEDPAVWRHGLETIRPLDVVGNIAPRPLLIVHGADDERVPVQDARDLAAVAGPSADLRIVHGASHRLRHDPRIVAILLGWLGDQR
jgi:alpha/beta superfamily hydrolase